jgi:hypothetical protein
MKRVKTSNGCAGNQPAVDKESRSTRYTYAISFLDILLDIGLILARGLLVAFRFVIKPPMIDVRLEAENHWLRYGKSRSSLFASIALRNPG